MHDSAALRNRRDHTGKEQQRADLAAELIVRECRLLNLARAQV
jgi:hypothetical protein